MVCYCPFFCSQYTTDIDCVIAGVLAVTRSLGDSSMKEFVVGSPYTTETTLGADDQFLIVACDGVSPYSDCRD